MSRAVAVLFLFVLALHGQDAGSLPPPSRWMEHFQRDLIRWWDDMRAVGTPEGNYPSTRCNDGTVVNFSAACAEVRGNSWLMQGDQYMVAMSRQIYGYGVAFHVTGDPKYLRMMKTGVDYFRSVAFDRSAGGTYSYRTRTGQPMPRVEWRNPQELAYAQLGIGFYYYLTRDPEVLPDLLASKDYIFKNYWNSDLGVLQWQLADSTGARALEPRLVATLDQLNAYMVLLTPVLPEPYRAEWTLDMVNLAYGMIGQFYSAKDGLFLLNTSTAEQRDLTRTTVDFGHTIKSLWMLRYIGQIADDPFLIEFAEEMGPKVLARAWQQDSGSWASEQRPGGLNTNKSWWIYAELDQFGATMALQDASYLNYLPRSYQYWLTYFVDSNFGEVWTELDGTTHRPLTNLPKQWPWKNAYHSMEHALVAYITTAQLQGQPVILYFAIRGDLEKQVVRPYFYRGRIEAVQRTPHPDAVSIDRVTFRGVR